MSVHNVFEGCKLLQCLPMWTCSLVPKLMVRYQTDPNFHEWNPVLDDHTGLKHKTKARYKKVPTQTGTLILCYGKLESKHTPDNWYHTLHYSAEGVRDKYLISLRCSCRNSMQEIGLSLNEIKKYLYAYSLAVPTTHFNNILASSRWWFTPRFWYWLNMDMDGELLQFRAKGR